MNHLKMSEKTSPTIVLLAGAAIMLSLPPVRRALFSAARMAVRSVLEMAHDFEHAKKQAKEKTQQIVEQGMPFEFSPEFPDEKLERFGRKLKTHGRHVAVLTAAGALSIVDRTKPFVDEIQSIISEAKMKNSAEKAKTQADEENRNEFESELSKKIPMHPGI